MSSSSLSFGNDGGKQQHASDVAGAFTPRPDNASAGRRMAAPSTVTPSATNKAAKQSTVDASFVSSGVFRPPGLLKSVRKSLAKQTLNFKINVECTSLKLSPSGNFLWGGFSDGTLRVFDLSGTFGASAAAAAAATTDNVSKSQRPFINSKLHQSYGAVACQIHARGVHTDLITTVDIAPDGKYVFCGVSRGAMELYAVHVGHLEEAVLQVKREELRRKKQRQESGGMASAQTTTTTATAAARLNMLDYIQVYCHSDAKLKGFGACTNAVVANQKKDGPTSYLLLTGKGIKNIHIWKFTPPKLAPGVVRIAQDDEDNGDWDQLYDTATNGNTIQLLEFYRTPEGKLVAASKSDLQKLRLWDLSFEEQAHQGKQRPKRPPYQDVDNSQAVLGLAGGFCVCGGDSMYNELSIVSLDQPNNAYNHTELALPTSGSGGSSSPTMGTSSRRQRRGEMKAVVSVAAPPQDSSHALLELDDGSLVQYSAGIKDSHQLPRLTLATPESTGIPSLPADFWRRSLCLANIAGVVIAASSFYNPNTNRGKITIRAIAGLGKSKDKSSDKIMSKKATKAAPPPSSPEAADAQALRNATQAPPESGQKMKKSMHRKSELLDRVLASVPEKNIKSSGSPKDAAHISPDKDLQTPVRTTTSLETSPNSTDGIPTISEVLNPKRVSDSERIAELARKRQLSQQGNVVAQSSQRVVKKRKKDNPFPAVVASETNQQSINHMAALKKVNNGASRSIFSLETAETAFQVSTKATIPISNNAPAGEKKRQRSQSDLDTALLLANLKAPTPSLMTPVPKVDEARIDGPPADVEQKEAVKPPHKLAKLAASQSKTQRERVSKPAPKIMSPRPAVAQSQFDRDASMRERISTQYKQLRAYIKTLSGSSVSSMHRRLMAGPALVTGGPPETSVQKYAKLMDEHRAVHESLQKRLLRSVETTLRLLLDGDIAADEARVDMKASVKRFEEILYDNLHRQSLEKEAFLAQHPRIVDGETLEEGSAYPCKAAFDKIEEICSAITRPVGRPKLVPVSPAPSRSW